MKIADLRKFKRDLFVPFMDNGSIKIGINGNGKYVVKFKSITVLHTNAMSALEHFRKLTEQKTPMLNENENNEI